MTFIERISLLGFGLFTWSLSMATASGESSLIVVGPSAIMAGAGAACFVTGLLPGRTARFS